MGDMNELVMRVRMTVQDGHYKSPQINIPVALYKDYFEGFDAVTSEHDGKDHPFIKTLRDDQGVPTRFRLSLPEVGYFKEPLISFSKNDRGISYFAVDGTTDEGKPLFHTLREGLETGQTQKTNNPKHPKIESATWWMFTNGSSRPCIPNPVVTTKPPVVRSLTKDEKLMLQSMVMPKAKKVNDPVLEGVRSRRRKARAKMPRSRQVDMTEGFLYIITNPAWPGIIKVGMSIDYEERADTYQPYCPFGDFEREYASRRFDDRRSAERLLKQILRPRRTREDDECEWYLISIKDAMTIFKWVEEESGIR